MSLGLVDFHCHLDLYPNFVELLEECERRKIYTLAVTTTPRAWQKNSTLASSTKYIRVAAGLHPQLVGQFHYEVDELCRIIPETQYVGEVGLDGSPEYADSLAIQKEVLNKILFCCTENGGRIISLHSRRAAGEVIDLLDKHRNSGIPILHWFTGSTKELERAINLGCWFSVGPAMLNSKKGMDIVSRIPREKLLTETDGPFALNGNNPCMPWDVEVAIHKIAKIWQEEPTVVQRSILSNFHRLHTLAP